MRFLFVLTSVALSGCAFSGALYLPGQRPPESHVTQSRDVVAPQADVASLALLARVMVDAGEPVNDILAVLQSEGLTPAQSKKILYTALVTPRTK